MTIFSRSIIPSVVALLLFATPAFGQSFTVAPTLGIDVYAPNEEIQVRLGGMVAWHEHQVGAALAASAPIDKDVSGFAATVGPTIRLAQGTEYDLYAIPSVGVARMPITDGVDTPYAPSLGLLFHLTDRVFGVMLGVKHTFKGTTNAGALRLTRGPHTSVIGGFSVSF